MTLNDRNQTRNAPERRVGDWVGSGQTELERQPR